MSLFTLGRRAFLKAGLKTGLALGTIALCGIRFGSEAHARAHKLVKSYMRDRLSTVYYADLTMPVRASQDNTQAQAVYRDFLGEPGGEAAHKYLHMHFSDHSAAVKALDTEGKLNNPEADRFKDAGYPFEWMDEWFSKKG